MVYGDGDGSTFSALVTLDICGHEMTHGVTESEANFVYSGESGGLDESMADVFGAMVERSAYGETSDTWLIGEDAYTPSTAGDALRYMNDPADDGYSHDYYSSSTSSADVHYSSGVPNLAFYLLAEGGTHPRGKSTTSVSAIGADAAASIWYRALATYMTSSTNFSGARTATLSAASDLYGATSAEYTAVGDAWTAVGVGTSSGGGGTSCTGYESSSTGTISSAGSASYVPSSSGFSGGSGTYLGYLEGPSSADFDLYLQKKGKKTWSTVASDTGSGTGRTVSYAGSSGTYRWVAYAASGSGSYTLCYDTP